MGIDLYLAGWLAITALLSAVAGLLGLSLVQPARPIPRAGLFADAPDATDFLFDGETLLDATPSARALLPHSPMRAGPAWARLQAWLAPRFPGLTEALARLPGEGRVTLPGADATGSPVLLYAEARGGLTRITLTDTDAPVASRPVATLADRAVQEELHVLRGAAARAPLPIWQETGEGEVIWANAAYLDLALKRSDADDLTWPLPRLFDPSPGTDRQRLRLDLPDAPGLWFDLVIQPDCAARTVFALPADAEVKAETALKGFMQTLTKTFAHLATGLAIFDQHRKLALFNPALADLTTLPPDFLAARPALPAFFDAMRDRSMLPEPRDYRDWRRRMVAMEEAAASGQYDETWTLPGGQTYHVTARPHPNGALALMFEDISTEMTQTRRYRADLELGQAVIDAMDEAIAVFAASGMLVMSNVAYADLWGHDPGGTLDGSATVAAISNHWRGLCAPTTVWDRAEDFAAAIGPDDHWADEVHLTDGRAVQCRMARLSGGATLIGFRTASLSQPVAAPVFASTRRTA